MKSSLVAAAAVCLLLPAASFAVPSDCSAKVNAARLKLDAAYRALRQVEPQAANTEEKQLVHQAWRGAERVLAELNSGCNEQRRKREQAGTAQKPTEKPGHAAQGASHQSSQHSKKKPAKKAKKPAPQPASQQIPIE